MRIFSGRLREEVAHKNQTKGGGGHTLALQHGGKNYSLLISCYIFGSYAQMCCKRYHIIFFNIFLEV